MKRKVTSKTRASSKMAKKTTIKQKQTRTTRSTAKASKPSTRSQARTGGGGLRASRVFSWAQALPIIIVLAIAGGFMVYRSFAGTAEDVTATYQRLLGRDPDTAGWYYWTDQLNKGMSISTLEANLKNTTEYKELQAKKSVASTPSTSTPTPTGSSGTPTTTGTKPAKEYGYGRSASPDPQCTFIRQCERTLEGIYSRLLGRLPDSNSAYWLDQIIEWGKTTADVEAAIKSTAEYKTRQAKLAAEAKDFTSSNTGVSDELFIARACLEVFLVDCNKEDAISGSKNSFERQFYELMKSGLTREEVYQRMVVSGFGGYRTATHRNDEQVKEKAAQERSTWNDFMYNLLNELTGGKYINPEGLDGLPYRPDFCGREAQAYLDGTIMYFDHTGTCFRAAGFAFDKDFYRQWRSGEVSLDQIANIVKTGETGESFAVMRCSEILASVIPECGGGAVSVTQEQVEAQLDQKKKERASKEAEMKKKAQESSSAPSRTLSQLPALPETATSTLDIAKAAVSKNAVLPVPSALQAMAKTQVVLGSAVEIEKDIVESIVFTDCRERKITITIGDSNNCVSFVQESLGLLGNTTLPVTGFYDEETMTSVSQFQKEHNVAVNEPGVIDVATISLLARAIESKKHNSPYAPVSGALINNR